MYRDMYFMMCMHDYIMVFDTCNCPAKKHAEEPCVGIAIALYAI